MTWSMRSWESARPQEKLLGSDSQDRMDQRDRDGLTEVGEEKVKSWWANDVIAFRKKVC